jgi:tRNA G18 (ribose-2'-O)-methylase SpoU
MGSLFRLPLIEITDPDSFLKQELQANVQTCGLIPRKGRPLFEWRPVFPLVVCIGSETQGLPENLPLTEKLSIPMKGRVESLNAAVAAAICLYRISSFAETYLTPDEQR